MAAAIAPCAPFQARANLHPAALVRAPRAEDGHVVRVRPACQEWRGVAVEVLLRGDLDVRDGLAQFFFWRHGAALFHSG
ncbi:MAG TPA: hypothetical protein VKT82_01305 [Ktedonobacterales bacterium]|nr:hypothetical protein [Ktedonobacterales bacterium]